MMLYTTVPLERIYNNLRMTEKDKKKEEEYIGNKDGYKEVVLANGRIVTKRDGENYVIEQINSTDMSDYLNEEYAPGKNISL